MSLVRAALSFAPGVFLTIFYLFFFISPLLCLFAPGFPTEKWKVVIVSGMVAVLLTGETWEIRGGKELSNPQLPSHPPL